MVKLIVYFVIFVSSFSLAMEEESFSHSTLVIDVTHHQSKHSSDQDAEHIAKAISYILGPDTTHTRREISSIFRQRMRESQTLQEDIRNIPIDHNAEPLQPNDDQLRRYEDIKKLVGQCVEKAMKDKEENLVDYQLQLNLRDKDIILARKKLYAAIATSSLSLAGIVITFVATYLSR